MASLEEARVSHLTSERRYWVQGKRVPDAVVEALMRKFQDWSTFDTIMLQLQYDSLNGCYHFNCAGMYHGVEPDGYIHT